MLSARKEVGFMPGLPIAQAMVEHGALSSLGAGVARLRSQIDAYIGDGNSTYLLIAALVVVVYLLVRRRR
jgi:hypothetical protein